MNHELELKRANEKLVQQIEFAQDLSELIKYCKKYPNLERNKILLLYESQFEQVKSNINKLNEYIEFIKNKII